MFRALEVRNYRLYFGGQVLSNAGTWMQRVAQDWLVLQLPGNSGTELAQLDGRIKHEERTIQYLREVIAEMGGAPVPARGAAEPDSASGFQASNDASSSRGMKRE